MNVVLVMFRENGERRSFSLTRDVTVIGRREDADFRIPLSDVSRKHSRLIKDGDTLLVEDLGSANGTYHNGVRVQESEVHAGDTIQVGPIQFVVQIDGIPSEDELLGNPGAVSTHLANNNFAMDAAAVGGAAALGGGEHEEELIETDDLEEVEDDQFAAIGDAGELEEVTELEEVGELEELPADDNVLSTTAAPGSIAAEDDAGESVFTDAPITTTDDRVATSSDVVATSDDLETADDLVITPPDLIGSAEDDEVVDENPIGRESAFTRPATPVRPAAPSLSQAAPTPPPPVPAAEPDAGIEEAPLAEESTKAVNAFDEADPTTGAEEIVDGDFIDMDTDTGTGEDDVLIDFGDDEKK